MTLPNFLILGAARSGTTSLHYYLDQHPDIAMSATKEPNFFAFDHRRDPPFPLIEPDARMLTKSVPDRAAYERLFHDARATAVGEASPLYLYVRETPELIRETLGPDVRHIAVLRHPVDRAYSHFLHVYRGDPAEAGAAFRAAVVPEIGAEYSPYRTGTHFLRLSRYADAIERYHGVFGPDRLLLLEFGELADDPATSLRRVCTHLAVDADFPFDLSVVYNRSGVTRNPVLRVARRAMSRAQPWVKAALPAKVSGRIARLRARNERPSAPDAIDPGLRRELVASFDDDITRVEALTGWSLAHWRA